MSEQVVIRDRAKATGAPRSHWGCEKRQCTLSITGDALKIFEGLADEMSSSRSEVMEILIRFADEECLDLKRIRKELLS